MTTDRARLVYDRIRELQADGYTPSQEELAEHFGVSHTTIQNDLNALEEAGLLERPPGKRRAIRIIDTKGTPT
jgi:repressor LexA